VSRSHSWPDEHWNWPIPVTHKHGLRHGNLCFVGGQVDLSPEGVVRHHGDLDAQLPVVIGHLRRVLDGLGVTLAALVKIVVFYVNDGTVDEQTLLDRVAGELAACRPAVTTVPVPYLAYPGMLVEIEGVAASGRVDRVGDGPFPAAVRCGDLIWTSAQDASGPDIVAQSERMMQRLDQVLGAFGADLSDVVKFDGYYVGEGTAEDWEVAARVRARYFPEPGPAATGLPLPRLDRLDRLIKMDVWAMRSPDGARLPRRHCWPEGHWDWPIHLPYKHGCACQGMIFVGGQVSLTPRGEVIDPGQLEAQTRTAMRNIERVLAGLGAGIDDVVKVNAFYVGDGSGDDLHANLAIRSACFTEPGPATTGVSLPTLAYRDMLIEIEVIAMPDRGG